jgi:UDP-glucose 4-epimerase
MSHASILITGANGFVGRHTAAYLAARGCSLTLAVRNGYEKAPDGARVVNVGDVSGSTQWSEAVYGVNAVIHTAGFAHQIGASRIDERVFFQVNVEGTKSLVRACETAAVPVVVNLSSIAVYDPLLGRDAPLSEQSSCSPASAYGQSKLEAEHIVSAYAAAGRSAIQLRPPLVFGPGSRGNWPRFEAIAGGPLPMPSIAPNSQRSILGIQNLCDAIWTAVQSAQRKSVSGLFNISDDGYVSPDDLIRWIRQRQRRLFGVLPYTSGALRLAAKLSGQEAMFGKMADSLMVDSTKFGSVFGWRPPLSTREAIIDGQFGTSN